MYNEFALKNTFLFTRQCPENLLYSALTSTCRQAAAPTTAPAVPVPAVTQAPTNTGGNTGTSGGNPCTAQALAAGNIYFAVQGRPRFPCVIRTHIMIMFGLFRRFAQA